MCGRYTLTRHEDAVTDLQASLGVSAHGEWWRARFNVAPTQPAPIVFRLDGGPRTLELFRWGLVPFWADGELKKPPPMINARSESLAHKQWFREALATRRCLVPADGFFEWRRGEGKGTKPLPIWFHPAHRHTIAFAGLWARAQTSHGDQLSFTIITGKPNPLVRPVHDRMPIVLDPASYDAWLDPGVDGAAAQALLVTPPVGDWIGEPVSQHVNKATNDDPECVAPVAAESAQRSLF
ncbi:MAG: SOS response-associated peptidase [Kofleriaceae bacterium]